MDIVTIDKKKYVIIPINKDGGLDGDEENINALFVPPYRETEVIKLLYALDMSPKLKGFRYIKEAVCMSLLDVTALENLQKLVYTPISVKYKTTPGNVEKAINNAIRNTWIEGNEKAYEIFPEMPTNTGLIMGLVNIILLESNA